MNNQSLEPMRHSCEHILHQAMTDLYPGLKRAMGPPTEDGFYFDFDYEEKISEADFPKIEKRMREIVNKELPIIREEIELDEAKKLFKDNPYKLEWIEQIQNKGQKATVYWVGKPREEGSDVDLCKGPHVESTNKVGPFKLLSVAGAYWHGDEKNKMLTRIYGTCFSTKEELEAYLKQIEEAKKRDHRKLGKELDLFTFSPLVGSGMPLYTQRGTIIRRLLNEYVENIQNKEGYGQVWTPQIAKADLFKASGHYDKYKGDMFRVVSNYSNEEMFLKPMNCPQHTQIYAGKPRSYRDLPLRLTDFAMLYRDEKPGELNGLARVRSFSQDDCHVFCREDQVDEEIDRALVMTDRIMKTFGFKYRYRLSTRDLQHPEKYIGDPKMWDKVEKWAVQIMKRNNIEYYDGPGEAAFYAPKMDLMATDALGREWQLSTVQIDFFMPARFGLKYTGDDGSEKQPVMIHRAILGSVERLLMILIEHYAGKFPVWLAPVQVAILPISDKFMQTAQKVHQALVAKGIRTELNTSTESIGKKIRTTTLQKVPYMGIIGQKEVDAPKLSLSVRTREGVDSGMQELELFISTLIHTIENHS
ncbi:MAG: threonine--tRNA ligase [bacterium]